MSDRLKLILRAGGFVVIVLILAWAMWAVFFRVPGTSVIPGREEAAPTGGLPPIGEAGERRLAPEGGISLLEPERAAPGAAIDTVAQGGRTLAEALSEDRADWPNFTGTDFTYYNESDGRFYRLSAGGGEPVLLSDEVFNAVERATWSANGDRAILEFPDGSNIFYDFKTKARSTLPRAGQDFTFSPSSEAIAYKYVGQAEDDRWLVVSEPNGEGQRLVQALGREQHNVQVAWSPTNQVVGWYREPTSSLGEEVFFVGFNKENFLSLQTNGLGFKGKWSPQGEQVLYSVYSRNTDFKPSLHIAGGVGDNIGAGNRSLRLATWPDKCVFAGESLLYCAVPQNLPEGAGLYPELAAALPDTIYKIDLRSNVTSALAIPAPDAASSFTVTNLALSSQGDELYFTDRVSGRIQRLRLR